MNVWVLPALLSADFLNLSKDIKIMEQAGADAFHLDVTDGQFVTNISYGIPVIRAVRSATDLPLDVHLMTEDPEQFLDEYARIGVDMLSFHIEATHHAHSLIKNIKDKGMKAGVALNPQTPVSSVEHLLGDVDFILIMTVNPGFGGQSFIPETLNKIRKLDQWKKDKGLDYEIEVDGGVNAETAKKCAEAGATVFVAGSYVYNSENVKTQIDALKEAVAHV